MFLWFGWWACQDVSRRLLNGNMLQILQNADTIISFHSKGKTAVWIQVNIWSELSFNMWNEISEKALNQILCKRWLASVVERDAGCMLSLCHSYCQHMPNTLQYCKFALPEALRPQNHFPVDDALCCLFCNSSTVELTRTSCPYYSSCTIYFALLHSELN